MADRTLSDCQRTIKNSAVAVFNFIYLSVSLSTNLSLYLSICRSIRLYIYLSISVYLPIYLSIHPVSYTHLTLPTSVYV